MDGRAGKGMEGQGRGWEGRGGEGRSTCLPPRFDNPGYGPVRGEKGGEGERGKGREGRKEGGKGPSPPEKNSWRRHWSSLKPTASFNFKFRAYRMYHNRLYVKQFQISITIFLNTPFMTLSLPQSFVLPYGYLLQTNASLSFSSCACDKFAQPVKIRNLYYCNTMLI